MATHLSRRAAATRWADLQRVARSALQCGCPEHTRRLHDALVGPTERLADLAVPLSQDRVDEVGPEQAVAEAISARTGAE